MEAVDGLPRHVARPADPHERGSQRSWGVWSPDGTRIAFNADYDDPDLGDDQEVWNIFTMDPDGGNVTRLTRSFGLDPGYSPGGTLIMFGSTEPGREGIWVMDADDGGNERLVSATPAGFESDFAPRFSPDGTKVVSRGAVRSTGSTTACGWSTSTAADSLGSRPRECRR